MRISRKLYFTTFTSVALGALLLAGSNGAAQNPLKLKKSMYIQATAIKSIGAAPTCATASMNMRAVSKPAKGMPTTLAP